MSVAILWDVENVTPKHNSSFINNLMAFLDDKDMKAALKQAFCNWSKEGLQRLAGQLADDGFELIHVPKARKNSADISLITHAAEMIFLYPHIGTFILITGDADFRPLLHTLRKQGKDTWIICDSRNASEDLLSLADRYFDYRNIEQAQFDDDDYGDPLDSPEPVAPASNGNGNTGAPANTATQARRSPSLTKERAFDLFEEAVMLMAKEKKKATLGAVKVKMKLLNEDFNEKQVGYHKWISFVTDAIAKTDVDFDSTDTEVLTVRKNKDPEAPEIFSHLLRALPADESYIQFSAAKQALDRAGVDLGAHGYTRFKKLAIDAEKRGLIETTSRGMNWFLKIKS